MKNQIITISALLTVPVFDFAQAMAQAIRTHQNQPTARPAYDNPILCSTGKHRTIQLALRCCWKLRWVTFSWLSTTILPSIGIIS